MKLAIIIVNYRTPEHVVLCLHSLAGEISSVPGTRVVIVDNNSEDGSVEHLKDAIDDAGYSWVTLLPQPRNGGFAFGNNAAIRVLQSTSFEKPDLVWLLNPDTRVKPGALASIIRFMETHPLAGIVGTRLIDENGNHVSSARRMVTPFTEFLGAARLKLFERIFPGKSVAIPPANIAHQCAWVSGASLIMRLKVLDSAGLMDENYFLYFEEIDFCRRVAENNWEIWFSPEAKVIHVEGASTKILVNKKRRAAYWYNSRRRFLAKQYGISGLIFSDICWSFGRLIRIIADVICGKFANDHDPKWFAIDLLWGDIRSIFDGSIFRAMEHSSDK